jgi:hypothetical protein
MKKLLLWTFALATLDASGLFGQTFTGTWQGALKVPQAPNGELRIVIKISTTDADKLSAELYSYRSGRAADFGQHGNSERFDSENGYRPAKRRL